MAHLVFEVTRTRIVRECVRVVAPNSAVAISIARSYERPVWREMPPTDPRATYWAEEMLPER